MERRTRPSTRLWTQRPGLARARGRHPLDGHDQRRVRLPFEGRVDPSKVVGSPNGRPEADEVVLADTIGVATPGQVRC
jgi:hypothetical protein